MKAKNSKSTSHQDRPRRAACKPTPVFARLIWLLAALVALPAELTAQDPFTKITEGPVATDLGCTWGAAWGDYDGDGYPDLFIAHYKFGLNTLYHNNRDGTFTRITTPPSAQSAGLWEGATWVDLDNDGRLDLLLVGENRPILVYWNNGDGTFTTNQFDTMSPLWDLAVVDYDRDGLLDLYFSSATSAFNRLYRGKGNRTFQRMTAAEVGPIVSISTFGGITWVDFDDDGSLELYAANHSNGRSYMYRIW